MAQVWPEKGVTKQTYIYTSLSVYGAKGLVKEQKVLFFVLHMLTILLTTLLSTYATTPLSTYVGHLSCLNLPRCYLYIEASKQSTKNTHISYSPFILCIACNSKALNFIYTMRYWSKSWQVNKNTFITKQFSPSVSVQVHITWLVYSITSPDKEITVIYKD